MKDDRSYLLHLLDAAEQALILAAEGRDRFIGDRKTRDAGLWNLEVLGETAKNLSATFRNDHPHVPWKRIAGMRDKLVHQYFGVSEKRIWEVLTEDLPALRNALRVMLAEFPEQLV